ncbi:MAG: hypothetical protein V1851_01265 [Patescibacteria group bacterium]
MEHIDFLNIQQIYYWIYLLIKNIFYFLNPAHLIEFFYEYWPIFMFYSFFISGALFLGIIYTYKKRAIVLEANAKIFDTVISGAGFSNGEIKNERWEKILQQINSESQSDWKMAIIDADVILDEILVSSGYHGDSLGERLRSVEISDFTTLNSAWEAHKIRNMIAHGGADAMLTSRMAKRAISLYKEVFEEFEYI